MASSIPAPSSQKRERLSTRLILLFSFILLLLVGCSDDADNKSNASNIDGSANKKRLKIMTSTGDFGDMVRDFAKPQLEMLGYRVELIETDDSIVPNIALNDGSIDLNIFQHKPYLDTMITSHDLKLAPAFQVPTAPYGIYPGRLASLDDVQTGSTIAVPKDPSNYARVLVILDHLGWIKLRENINPLTASSHDIEQNIIGIKLVEIEGGQIPRALRDVDYAAISGNFVISSGMKLSDAIFTEPSFTMINWAVVRENDLHADWVNDLKTMFSSSQFREYIDTHFNGYQLPEEWE